MNRGKNTKAAEIALVVILIVFLILVAVTYKNLSILSEGMNTAPAEQAVETTTEIQ